MSTSMEDKLDKLHTHINDLIRYAETKNFALLAFNGVVLLELIKHLDTKAHISWSLETVVVSYAIVLNIVSFFIGLSALIPTQRAKSLLLNNKDRASDNLLFFGNIALYGEESYLADFKEKYGVISGNDSFCLDMIRQLIIQSQILVSKLNKFKMASLISFCAFTSPLGYFVYKKVLMKNK